MYQQLRLAAFLSFLPFSVLAGPQLVTPEEAALPAGDIPRLRGINRGPSVEVLSPAPVKAKLRSPLNLRVRFEGHGGRPIDPASLQVLYVKSPNVDVTSRVTPYASEGGFTIDAANVPPGEHTFVISVADSSGRRGMAPLTFEIER